MSVLSSDCQKEVIQLKGVADIKVPINISVKHRNL